MFLHLHKWRNAKRFIKRGSDTEESVYKVKVKKKDWIFVYSFEQEKYSEEISENFDP